MSDKVYLGSSLVDMSAGDPLLPVSKVILNVDSKTRYEAGDDSGTTIEQDCSWATQEMAESILAKLRGFEYRPFEGDGAFLSPTAELGDGITVGGIYTVLASMGRTFDTHLTATIGAPGSTELEDEYPYESKEMRQTNRQLAQARSLISKTAEEILMKVEGEDGKGGLTGAVSSLGVALGEVAIAVSGKIGETEANSLISTAIGKIKLSVSSANGSTTFQLTDQDASLSTQTLNLTVDAVNINGKLTAKQIDASELKVDAANITGTLIIGQQLPSNLATTSDIPSATDITLITNNAIQTGTIRVNSLYGENIYLKYPAGNDYFGNPVYGNAGIITVSNASTAAYAFDLTSYGAIRLTANSGDIYLGARGSVTLGGSSGASCIGNFMPGGANDGVFSLGASWSRWSTVYAASSEIVTSDRNKKHSIDYDLTRYENLFGRLMPAIYKFNDGTSDRFHIGFISQDVEEGLTESDMTSLDFAGFIKSPKKIEGEYDYALRYEEFIALNTYMIQKLMSRVAKLESRLGV